MTDPRLSRGNEPRFDIDLAWGQQGETFVLGLLDGVRERTVEVKHDRQAARTGNVYIEYRCSADDIWHLSGISTTQATHWAYVINGRIALFLATADLKVAVKSAVKKGLAWRSSCPRGSRPTKGVLIPITVLLDEIRSLTA